MLERAVIDVVGQVQGVGFRPFVYGLATSLHLRGFVQNRGGGVFIDAEGEPSALRRFIERLTAHAPAAARVDCIAPRRVPPASHPGFVIADSIEGHDGGHVMPDLASCPDCVAELFDPANRRYRHPFIACTACGPRYSVITAVPYDRARTTMNAFAMCADCDAEYRNPRHRRFHAQAITCPACGPVLVLEEGSRRLHGDAGLSRAEAIIRDGGIVAVKGLGGFHLACDATSLAAVQALRRRKGRDAKPLAAMIGEAMAADAVTDAAARAALASPVRPIVLVPRQFVSAAVLRQLAPEVAGGCPSIGLLLPYTPVHHLLVNDLARPLVMTSGNLSDEPMVCTDDDARRQLGDVADAFLLHDRVIQARCDDSIVRTAGRRTVVLRRGRGLAPADIPLGEPSPVPVLGVGAHLKNAVCLAVGHRAYVSPHVGDLQSAATYDALHRTVRHLASLTGVEPAVVAHDRHPDYLSTRFAGECGVPQRVAVQHHHAHVLSCIAEYGISEPVIGVAFDGAGLGDDGAVWGGEFLLVHGTRCERLAHLAYVPLPGGDAAARQPWRMALAHLMPAYDGGLGPAGDIIRQRVGEQRFDGVLHVAARGLAPPTSSMGRLFDAVASLVCACDHSRFEGEAAMMLEAQAAGGAARTFAFDIRTAATPWQIDAAPVIRAVAEDVGAGTAGGATAAAFHDSVAAMVADVTSRLAREHGIRVAALTGGVFQNAWLHRRTRECLSRSSLRVLEHRQVPCNDGGIAVGQALLASRLVARGLLQEPNASCV